MSQVPGQPSQAELAELRGKYLPRGLKSAHPVFVDHARGSLLWGADGTEYLDFAGGIGAMNVGHSHPLVLDAAHRQLDKLTHTSFQVAGYESYLRLAARIASLAPGAGSQKVILFNSGAEAVENSVKIARAYSGRTAVIGFTGAFHGRTLLAMTLTGTDRPYKEGFGPFAPAVYRAPYPYEFRGWSVQRCLEDLQRLLEQEIPAEQVAAFLIEPVLGEGGFVPAPAEFLQGLRRVCDEHGILLIADEVQSGMGRTGRMFAIEHSGVSPDMTIFAKSVAAGLPLSGVVGNASVMDGPEPGSLGGTYGGNPVACAAALAVLDVIEDEKLLARATTLGSLLEERMADWKNEFRIVGDVRGLGAMAALELVTDRPGTTPASEAATRILEGCRQDGLLLLKAGPYQNVLRTLMPLNIPDEVLDRGLDIIERNLASADAELRTST